jgi:virulence factor Mce-like protein
VIARRALRLTAIAVCGAALSTACGFEGVNSLPLPGAVGREAGASIYHAQFVNVGTLEPNSPVLIDDVVVGSVGNMTFSNWIIDVDVSIRPDVAVPANAVASVGQTSLLGSMHLALDPPVGEVPRGRLEAGSTIAVDRTATYPSTEQTLSSLSAVVTGGGLGQIGDIIHNLNVALSGRQNDVRELITRLDTFVGTLERQRQNIVASIEALNKLAVTFADQRDVISRALTKIPPALDVLISERPRITTALDKLRVFSDTTTGLVNDTQENLVKDLRHLEPTLRALADVGTDLDTAIAFVPVFPFGQNLIDRGVRGDYINFFGEIDFTYPRLKRSLLLGTRWGDEEAKLIPAPGEPYYLNYSYNPLNVPLTPSAQTAPPESTPEPGPLLPVEPPPGASAQLVAPPGSAGQVFAGPYGAQQAPQTGGG